MAVIETMTFRLRPGADESQFRAVDQRVQTDFAYQQPGLLRRTTARGPHGDWLVVDLWASEQEADAMSARWDAAPLPAEFMSYVDAASVDVRRYTPLD